MSDVNAPWSVSSTYVSSLVSSMKHFAHHQAVHAELDAQARAMIDAPSSRKWWPGQVFVSLLLTYERLHGREAVSRANVHTSTVRMGPLVRPLASVLLALAKVPAAALLSRLPTFLEPGVHGVQAAWEPRPDGAGGHVRFIFPEPVPEVMCTVWHGLFDTGFTLARQGRVVKETLEPSTHHYDVAW